jgi:hypothetical protein
MATTKQLYRPTYFEGQFLGSEDLTAAVEYGRLLNARHQLGAHTWGIAIGLNLKEVTMPGNQVVVFVQAGYVWDGLGRTIVLLNPVTVPAEKFKSFVYDPLADEPGGRLVPVWLKYREIATSDPPDGFQLCTPGDHTSRAFETWDIEVGDLTLDEQRDRITVAGTAVKAEEAFRAFDAADPLIPDASIPHQTFPTPGGRQRWLIPLGYVRWKPNPISTLPGQFQPTSADDKLKSADIRVHVGAVAAAIQAPEGVLRLKSRINSPSLVRSDDLVWVEGKLRAGGDIRMFGTMLEFLDTLGQNQGVPLSLRRAGDNVAGSRQLRIYIGTAEAGVNRLDIGPEVANNFVPKVSVLDNGRLGVGTTAPGAKFELNDGDLLIKGAAEDPGDIIFQNNLGVQKARVWSNPNAGAGLFLASAGTNAMVAVHESGQVGIGTTTPSRAVTVFGANPGVYLNVIDGGGTHEILMGVDGNGGIVSTMTNHDLILRSGSNVDRVTIKAAGNVGVNNSNPAVRFHVSGNRIRLENQNKTVDLRADGSAVDVHSETSDLYIRSSGPAGANRVIVNPFGSDGFVAIGNQAPVSKLHVTGNVSGDATNLDAHVAVIENINASTDADVLALRVAQGVPTAGNNYITFFAGNAAVGRIEGNVLGGITYQTSGADFAEALELLEPGEAPPAAGDVVGVVEGKVTLRTDGACHVGAITEAAAVVGNVRPGSKAPTARLALVGQVRIKVRGAVRAGDLLFPSGLNDGAAVSLTPEDAAREGRTDALGTAWQSSPETGIHRVLTAVGLAGALLRLQQASLDLLRKNRS